MPARVSVAKVHQPLVPGVLRQIHRSAHPQGQHHDESQDDDIQGVHQIGQDACGPFQRAGRRGQQFPSDVGQALDENISDQEHQQCRCNARRQVHSRFAQDGEGPPAQRQFFLHAFCAPFFIRAFMIRLMTITKPNSTSAMENKACRWRPEE